MSLYKNQAIETIERFAEVNEPQIKDEFVRYEEKFFLPMRLRTLFMDLVEQHMPPFYPNPNTRFTLIESIYYDSADLKSLTDHLNKEDKRHKIRTRRYGPNGLWDVGKNNEVFIELKSKEHEVTDKTRHALSKKDFLHLQLVKPLDLPDKKPRHVKKMNRLLELYQPKPVCRVTYRRFAFQMGSFRVTIDDQLQTELLAKSMSAKSLKAAVHDWHESIDKFAYFDVNKYSLVEIKHKGHYPFWLIEFMEYHGLAFRSFSKYCHGMLSATNSNKELK